ncbi:hypothetical protein CRENBAI_005033 [Crenichthys baileyi]|uniref:Uncharacterized protein n=1 Tax=Crenichthys baileyi TaxID=28760 RepID=A0AAV9S1F8_9TELE
MHVMASLSIWLHNFWQQKHVFSCSRLKASSMSVGTFFPSSTVVYFKFAVILCRGSSQVSPKLCSGIRVSLIAGQFKALLFNHSFVLLLQSRSPPFTLPPTKSTMLLRTFA